MSQAATLESGVFLLPTAAFELLEQGSFLAEDQIATTFSNCLNGDQIKKSSCSFSATRQYFHTSTLYADTGCTLQSWDLTSTWWHTVRAYAKVLSREGNLVTVKMPSSEAGKLVTRWFGRHAMDCQFFAQVRLIPEDCWCTIGKARWAIAWNIVKW